MNWKTTNVLRKNNFLLPGEVKDFKANVYFRAVKSGIIKKKIPSIYAKYIHVYLYYHYYWGMRALAKGVYCLKRKMSGGNND